MRRREPPAPPDAPPQRFRYDGWAGETADGPVPEYWGRDVRMWHKIRAFKRYLAAKLVAAVLGGNS